MFQDPGYEQYAIDPQQILHRINSSNAIIT